MAGALVKTAIQGVKASGANIGDAINLGFAYSDYKGAREQGNSRSVSIAKAGASFAWGEFFYGGISRSVSNTKLVSSLMAAGGKKALAGGALTLGASIGLSALMGSAQIVSSMGQHTAKTMSHGYAQRGKLGSGYFDMTQAGYTMRQRSLNAIRSNGLNTQSVLGNEARTYYRGSYQ